jgi:hypothetical protein
MLSERLTNDNSFLNIIEVNITRAIKFCTITDIDIDRCASYLDLHLEIDSEGRLKTKFLMQLCISWCISLRLCGHLNFSACPTWSLIKLYASSFNRSWMFSDCTFTRTKMPLERFVSYITHASHHFCLWYSILTAQSFIKAASLYLFLFSRQVGTTSSGMLLHMNGKFTMRKFKSSFCRKISFFLPVLRKGKDTD